MQFSHAYKLAQQTPMKALRKAWGTCALCTVLVAREKRPMTLREAGALAELHGLELLDVLAV